MAVTSRPLVDPMIRRVYKYPLRVEDETWVTMPFDAKVLAVQEQLGEPYLWALVFPSGPPCERRFRLVGTGHDIVLAGEYGPPRYLSARRRSRSFTCLSTRERDAREATRDEGDLTNAETSRVDAGRRGR